MERVTFAHHGFPSKKIAMTHRVRLLVASCTLLTSCAVLAATQPPQSEIRSAIYQGCLQAQQPGAVNSSLQPQFMEQTCGCMADKITQEIFTSKAYQDTAARGDNEGMKRAMGPFLQHDHMQLVGGACIKARGVSPSDVKQSAAAATKGKQTPLKGAEKSDFHRGLLLQCVNDLTPSLAKIGWTADRARQYCTCGATYTADRTYAEDLVQLMRGEKVAIDKTTAIQSAASDYCAKKVGAN